jgi:hypothetical protein
MREQTDSYVYELILEASSVLFYLEALGKLRALGRKLYARDEWCRFELRLVWISLVEQSRVLYLISDHAVKLPPMLLRLPRALQALRAVRLLKHARRIRWLVTTTVLSLPSLVNVSSILAIVMFIFSVLGMQLFTFLGHGEAFTDVRNYETFGNALLVSLQCLTSDGWSSFMFEARSDPEHGSWRAVPFFLGFQVLVTVILNLVVAVILDNFTNPVYLAEPVATPGVHLFIGLSQTSCMLDPANTGCIGTLLNADETIGVRTSSPFQQFGSDPACSMNLEMHQIGALDRSRPGTITYSDGTTGTISGDLLLEFRFLRNFQGDCTGVLNRLAGCYSNGSGCSTDELYWANQLFV